LNTQNQQTIGQQNHDDHNFNFIHDPKALQAWLEDLPLVNVAKSAEMIQMMLAPCWEN